MPGPDDDETREARTLVDADEPASRPVGAWPSPSTPDLGVSAAARYAKLARLGQGAMGDVVLVEDGVIGRRVALKKLKPDATAADPSLRSRFARESRVQARLEHPAIVPVYDIGAEDDGSLFFTMKRVRGKPLSEILRALARADAATVAQYPRRRLLGAFGQLCLAVHYAHEHGVVHRDIKPSNVMLGDYGEVYLLDWGVAKLIGETEEPTSGVLGGGEAQTQLGDVVGTVGYMSPEQARGGSAHVGPAADVYSLGCMLFEILTLQPVLARDVPTKRGLRMTVEGVLARPSVRVPEARVPAELDELCARATARDPDERPATARALHDAVEAFLDGDRNLELRRELSRQHTSIAAPAAANADQGSALRSLGQALAFDPKNRVALQSLVTLLRNPPEAMPPEVVRAREEESTLLLSRAGVVGAAAYSFALFATIFLHTQHVVDPRSLVAMEAAWGSASIAGLVVARRPTYPALLVMFVLGTMCVVWALRSVMGPFAVVPGMLALHGVLYSLSRLRQVRWFVLGVVCVAWTFCVFGESLGLIPLTTEFVQGGLVVRSPLVELTPGFARGFLYFTVLAVIAVPSVVAGLVRAAQASADDRTRVMMWQLQQLLPDEARRDR